jgi:hypothetical protein
MGRESLVFLKTYPVASSMLNLINTNTVLRETVQKMPICGSDLLRNYPKGSSRTFFAALPGYLELFRKSPKNIFRPLPRVLLNLIINLRRDRRFKTIIILLNLHPLKKTFSLTQTGATQSLFKTATDYARTCTNSWERFTVYSKQGPEAVFTEAKSDMSCYLG